MASCRNRKTRDKYILEGGVGVPNEKSTDKGEGTLSIIFNGLFLLICISIVALMIAIMGLSVENLRKYYKLKAKYNIESENNPTIIRDSFEYKLLNYTKNPKTEPLLIKTIINLTFTVFTLIGSYIIILFSEFALFAGIKLYKSLKEKSAEGDGAAPETAPEATTTAPGAAPIPTADGKSATAKPSLTRASSIKDRLTGLAKRLPFQKKEVGGMTTEEAIGNIANGLSMFGGVSPTLDEFKPTVKPAFLILIVIAAILMSIVDDATKNIYMVVVLPDLNKIKDTIRNLRNNIRNNIYPDDNFLNTLKQNDIVTMKNLIINELNKGSNGIKNVSKMAFTYNIYKHYEQYLGATNTIFTDDFHAKFNAEALSGVSKTGNFEPAEFLSYTDVEIEKITFIEKFMCEFVNDSHHSDLLSAIGSNYKVILTDVNRYLKMANTHSTKLSKTELAINLDSFEEYIKTLRVRSIIAGSLIIAVAVMMIIIYYPDLWAAMKELWTNVIVKFFTRIFSIFTSKPIVVPPTS